MLTELELGDVVEEAVSSPYNGKQKASFRITSIPEAGRGDPYQRWWATCEQVDGPTYQVISGKLYRWDAEEWVVVYPVGDPWEEPCAEEPQTR